MSKPHSGLLAKTPLYALHKELGARLVPFAGYEMPVQYPTGIIQEHRHTRTQAGLFDVSHMGQVRLAGEGAARALESLVPVDVVGLPVGQQRYALFTNEAGGILDDLMITNAGDHLFLVVNAACKEQDIAHLRTLADHCTIEVLSEQALLALQGPEAVQVIARLAPVLTQLVFMKGTTAVIEGIECFVTRSGYTGEDGFEISVPADRAEALARTLLAQPGVAPAGLGARDSLRLEAGLCLYGNDIDTSTTPVEASLSWVLSKVRRAGGERAGGFPGAAIILKQLAEGVSRQRVGIQPEGRVPVREGTALLNSGGTPVGNVTSGGFGPTVGRPVAMGYVATGCAQVGMELQALVRGKPQPVRVVQLPFAPHRYYRA
jgi:aminomethyltransferase